LRNSHNINILRRYIVHVHIRILFKYCVMWHSGVFVLGIPITVCVAMFTVGIWTCIIIQSVMDPVLRK